MKIMEIEGVSVSFPLTPYACQEEFMRQVIATIQSKENALLESPTGTGKTLSLLCSVLGYQAHCKAKIQLQTATTPSYADYLDEEYRPRPQKSTERSSKDAEERAPIVIFASRTHSQLAQVVKELRTTVYRPRMYILGSREQLCRHPKVKQITNNTAQAAICRQLVTRRACPAYNKVASLTQHLQALHLSASCMNDMRDVDDHRVAMLNDGTMVHSVPDLEDIGKMADSHEACGYYGAREGVEDAELILLPYNYLLDPKTSGVNINLANAIIVIDEAHNIGSCCLDSVSLEISLKDLNLCMEEVDYFTKHFGYLQHSDALPILPVDLKKFICGLIALVESSAKPQGDIFKLLSSCGGVTYANSKKYLQSFTEVKNRYLERKYEDQNITGTKSHLQSILDLLLIVYKDACIPRADLPGDYEQKLKQISESYRIHVEGKEKFCYWCFNPGIVMQALKANGVRSVILASGTLSPLPALECDLQLPFKHQLENEHIITDQQILAAVVRSGPSRVKLTSSFEHRENEMVRQELGFSLLNLLPKIPQGVLVFFPSYTLLDTCVAAWSVSRDNVRPSIIQSIKAVKELFLEPKNKNDLPAILRKYSSVCKDGSGGAVLFAVARGKISEGLDFTDGLCRGVIVTGIPFPPLKDPRVTLKREYLDSQQRTFVGKAMLTGDVWYTQQAARAVNQAIGRVIRHAKDFGVILLLDERFGDERNKKLLSKWVRSRITVYDDINGVPLHPFFLSHSKSLTSTTPKKSSEPVRNVYEPVRPDPIKKVEQLQKAVEFFSRVSKDVHSKNVHSNAVITLEGNNLGPPVSKRIKMEEERIIDVDLMKSWSNPATIIEEKPHITMPFKKGKSDEGAAGKSTQVKEYLQKIKSFFNHEDYKLFCELLGNFRKKSVGVDELVPKLKRLFLYRKSDDDDDGKELFIGFKSFVPSVHQHLFDLPYSDNFSLKKENILEDAGIMCPICRDPMKVPYKAKCGHVCCYSCWTGWLSRVLECPICRNRTRLATLSPIGNKK